MSTSLPFPEYDQLDGLALADCIRRGDVSPADVTEAAIARMSARNPALNAIVRPLESLARTMAAQLPAEAPFAGVPMVVKDLVATIAGVPTSYGTRVLQQVVPDHDSELVARYRRAGAVFIGKSNTPEFGLTPFTESEALGPARNPWDVSRTTGGSSGGSGAAVAARIVPIGHGGDGGGSIRIPASCAGLFGLKPSRGRLPMGPDAGDAWRGFVQEHVITRSVRDSAAMLDCTAGDDIGTPLSCPPQERPYLDEVQREPGRLRIAATTEPFFADTSRGDPVHADCRAALEDAVALLRSLGHDVEIAAPTFDGPRLARAFLTVVAAECRADIEWMGEQLRRAPRNDDVEAATWALGLVGGSYSAADYASSVRLLQLAGRTVGRFFTQYDVLVTPTLGAPPFPIGALQPSSMERAALALFGTLRLGGVLRAAGLLDETARKVFGFIPYTPLFNVTGQPAMSVPLYWNAQGLPIGTQYVSRLGDEATLFRLAGQLERARPWAGRVPPSLA
ncbi:amidase [Gemmatimonas sp.]|uniref:amidase n=1 Tax=Gemmatimonas sp. TaxID=1962908 RepID=UPI0027BADDAF|nr:amidase [Gemmatimonas sp.]